MGNYIYCGDKIFRKSGETKQEFVSLDDRSMTKFCSENDNMITTMFKQNNTIYDIGIDCFELLQYDDNIIEVGFSDEFIRGLKDLFKDLVDFHVENKKEYLIEEAKIRKRGI